MLGANLLLLVCFAQAPQSAPERDPAALVAQLGAPRYADRQAAAEALEKIGRAALPALRSARDSRDPEVRTRAWSLLQKIDVALLTVPTRIRLDFHDAPLADVTKSLSAQAGFKMATYPPSLPKWRLQRVTLERSQPLDFWKAIDQLCEAADLQYNTSMHGFSAEREPTFTLSDGSFRSLTPVSDFGPFRVALLGVDYQRHLTYGPSAGTSRRIPQPPRPAAADPPARRDPSPATRLRPVTNVQFAAQLAVAAEPRLTLTYQNASLQLIEAVDDRGNSLIPAGKTGPASRTAAFFGITNGSVVQVPAPLNRPAAVGETIARLHGTIPLKVASRRPDPLVVPLAGAVGKSFENLDVQISISEVHAIPNTRNTFVGLTIRHSEHDASSSTGDADAVTNFIHRPDVSQLQIDATDIRGQVVPWFQSATDAENSRVALTLTRPPNELKELRYYSLTRSSVVVPFAFTDIPMP